MSNIRCEKTTIAIYPAILQAAISDVKRKIGVCDDGIEWIIFDEKDHMAKECGNNLCVPSFMYKMKYGYCYIKEKQIYISTAAISNNIAEFAGKMPGIVMLPKRKNGIFLVNVILDELAHIKTGKGHNSKIYNDTLARYHSCYYGATYGYARMYG